MNKFILMLLASIGLALVCGCDGSTSQVRNGILSQHPDVTVGAAFDASFDNAKWETVTDKGRKIVRVTGKINQRTHDVVLKLLHLTESSNCENSNICYAIINDYKADELKAKLKPYTDKIYSFSLII